MRKCGGTWVRTALKRQRLWRDRVGCKHSTPAHVNDVLRHHRGHLVKHWLLHPWVTPGALRRAVKFCFVRDPIAFPTFVERVLERRPGYVSEMYGWYAEGCDA